MSELQKQSEIFHKLDCEVLVVTFGELNGAKKWLLENQLVKYPLVVDSKRILYNIFNLKRSFSRVWNTKTLIYYAEQLKLKRELPHAYKDILDDPHQMGGNFIIETNSYKLLYAYRSRIPPDRPSCTELLNEIEKLNQS